MNPREELIERMGDALCKDDPLESLVHLADNYAIGRWVPVEERLPENGARCVVRGHDNKLFCADHFCNGIWDKWEHEPTVTHWLDLSMPSGKEEHDDTERIT